MSPFKFTFPLKIEKVPPSELKKDGSTPLFGPKLRKKYNEITTSWLWRHIIGRISCAARIPIYASAAIAQGTKTGIKAIVSPVVTAIACLSNTDKLDAWTFTGVAKDAIMTAGLIDRTLNSALCVLCAPPKEYRSFIEAVGGAVTIVVVGKHHNHHGQNGLPITIETLAKLVFLYRPQYHKQMIACDYIYSSSLLKISAEFCRIKAG